MSSLPLPHANEAETADGPPVPPVPPASSRYITIARDRLPENYYSHRLQHLAYRDRAATLGINPDPPPPPGSGRGSPV